MSYRPESDSASEEKSEEPENGVPIELKDSCAGLDELPTEEFLRIVGLRVRTQRSSMSMSRKRLAEVSGVSERYLAQLESGQGNMSIALLRKVTSAIGMPLATLLSGEIPEIATRQQTSLHVSNEGAEDTQGGLHHARELKRSAQTQEASVKTSFA